MRFPRPVSGVALHALCCALPLIAAASGLAQGLVDPRSGTTLPYAQSAAVDDATALFTNPAGLANITGLELQSGFQLRPPGAGGLPPGLSNFDAGGAFSGFLGTGSAGVGLTLPDGRAPVLRTSLGYGAALDDGFFVGAALHGLTPLDGSAGGMTFDLGTQIRPARFLALGLVAENLGAKTVGAFGPGLRAGISLRPLEELLTIGVDARVVPSAATDAGVALQTASFTPGINARLRLGGVVVGGGASIDNLIGGSSTLPVAVTVGGLLQFDLEHLGMTFLGGATGVGGDNVGADFGLRSRFSSATWPSFLPDTDRWLEFRLTGDGIPVRDDDNLWKTLFDDPPNATWVLAALDNAVDDPSVTGIVLRFEGLSLGFGKAADLRAAITRLRAAGKKVGVYMVSGDDVDAWIASAADRVWLAPTGGLGVDGVRAQMVYVGEALHRIGISAEAVSAGRYKSAPRTFTHSEPSAEELEVEGDLLDGAYNALVKGLADGRSLEESDVRDIIDLGGLSAQEALEKGLVDALAYDDELPALISELAERPGERVFVERRFLERELRTQRWDNPPRIAIIPISGTIQMGSSAGGLFGGDGAGSDDVVEAIRAAAAAPDVVAIVLRIDSPGGDALASDLMWRAAMVAREKKPVIASMGDVAASGGYYVAAAANEILAQENTITGSIGVFGLMFNGERLADDLGINAVEVSRGARPGPNLLRGTTEAERERLQESVDATYERFLDAIITGRGSDRLTKDALREIAEGRVWTGAQAKERALVDAQGGLLDALRVARERAGLAPDAKVALALFSGDDELPGLSELGGVVSVALGLPRPQAMQMAARLLFGDPELASLVVQSEGRPLTLGPSVQVR